MKRCYTPRNFKPDALAIIKRANDICAEYRADGYDLTLRQLYYQFVARGFIKNKQTEYKRLGSIVNDARLAGLLDWDYIVDRTRNLSDLPHWESPADIVAAVAAQFRLAKWDVQPVRVEVWVEKEALAGVVERVCQRLDVPFFACRGYVSQSEQWAASQRFYHAIEVRRQRVVILHLGDHDPSGIDMTRDNRDRLEGFILSDWLGNYADDFEGDTVLNSTIRRAVSMHIGCDEPPFEVRRIALNMDQVQEYDPPPNPAKLTDSRVAGYLDNYGDESWELDALPPDVLANLIEENVVDLRDEDLWDDVSDQQDNHRSTLRAVSARWPEIARMVQGEDDEP